MQTIQSLVSAGRELVSTREAAELQIPPALAAIAGNRDILPTNEAAPALNRRSQTLRKWAAFDCGPIRPVRINGRLGWRVADIARLLNGGE